MKVLSPVVLIAAALLAGSLRLIAAEGARFTFLAAVYADDAGGGLRLPEGVACDDDGRVVVGDTGNDRLVRFGFRDRTVSPGVEIRIPQLSAPVRVHLDSTGRIYALDGRERRIVRLSATGEHEAVLSFEGAPAPARVVPKSFAIDADDRVYVLDVFAARVLVLADGRVQRSLPLPEDARFVTDLAIDDLGTLVVLDSIGRRIYAAAKEAPSFSPIGGDLTNALVTLPSTLASAKGLIFVVEGSGGGLAAFGQDGAFLGRHLTPGWKDGSLNHPSQLCINDRDEVFVADRDNSRVQVFSLSR